MPDTSYDGQLGYPYSFVFTPTSGTPFGTVQFQAEEADPPTIAKNTPTFTPISGPNAGIEQFVIANAPIKTYQVLGAYNKASYQAALVCWNAGIKGTLACTYADGLVETWRGAALTSVGGGKVDGAGLRKATTIFTVPASPTTA